MYRLHAATTKKPVTQLKDLQSSKALTPAGFEAVRKGDVVVRWGAVLSDTSEEGSKDPADEVLAFEKAVPTEGGLVLMLNRTTKQMTAEEFKGAKLAGTASSSGDTSAKGKVSAGGK